MISEKPMRLLGPKIVKSALSIASIVLTVYCCEYIVMTVMGQKPIFVNLQYISYNYVPIVVLCILVFSITNRLILSCFSANILALAAVSINAKKFEILSKPLMPSDLLLYKQLLEDPQLYLNYVPLKIVITVAIISTSILLLLVMRERSFFEGKTVVKFARAATAILLVLTAVRIPYDHSLIQRLYSNSLLPYYPYNPAMTVQTSGFFYNFIRMSSGITHIIPRDIGDPSMIKKAAAGVRQTAGAKPSHLRLPNIIVVQNESFYDLRKHSIQINEDPYSDFDKAAKASVIKGSLRVPTIGGDSVRTEFSFLTGISLAALPWECDYPYRFLVRDNVWSIAQHLKSIGYKTIVVHPFSRTFWDRNIAMPLLGFDQFMDIRYFDNSSKEGYYVSDQAIADRVISLTKKTTQPLFIFAITMENHGSWDSKRVDHQRQFRLTGKLTNTDNEQLGRYLHHVVNSAKMANALIQTFQKQPAPTLVTFYGDHAPGFNDLLDRIKLKDKKDSTWETPYFIWKNFGRSKPLTKDLDVSFLASTILDEAGVNYEEYFQANLYYRDISQGRYDNKAVNQGLRHSYDQLMYDNLLDKLGKVYSSPDQHISIDGSGIDTKTVIADYGPKQTSRGTGFNVQPDGNSAIWMVASGINKNHVIFADGKPLATCLGGDGKSITAAVPIDLINEKKTISLYLNDTVRHLRSKEVYLTVK